VSSPDWPELLRDPAGGAHYAQAYQDAAFLCEAVAEYVGCGLRRGEAALLIARPAHAAQFLERLSQDGLEPEQAMRRGQLVMLDADETLARFTPGGMPDWQTFHALIGGRIAELRRSFPGVRAYGEMVDLLWQRGERDAAMRLEEFWNDLARLQSFSLLCAYAIDPLDPAAYAGPLECLCRVHTHLIPTRDYGRLNQAVVEASDKMLAAPLSGMLLALSAGSRPAAAMPEGQATLLWLKRNMPRTAEKVLAEVRALCAP
jgi:hypothetical protein